MYLNNDHKFCAVLNKQVGLSQLMNALAHMSAGLVATSEDPSGMRFLRYTDGDKGIHPAISEYPFIILKAKNSGQIRRLREAALVQGISYNDFVHTMVGDSAEHQQQDTAATRDEDLEYYGIVLFGPAKLLQPLTRRFSLF